MADDTQVSAQPATAADSTVGAFMALDEGKQRDVLGKMSPEAKQALLTGIKTRKARPAVASSKIPAPPKWDDPSSTPSKLVRGAELGAATGLGIPESTSPWKVASGAFTNAVEGYAGAVKSAAQYADPRTKLNSPEGIAYAIGGPLGPTAMNVGKGIVDAGGEAWKGLKEKDPEAFAHGLANALTQTWLLSKMRDAKPGGEVDPAMRQARVSSAIKAGGEEHAALEKAMPRIVEKAKEAGISNVQELGAHVKAAHTAVNYDFERGFDPIRNKKLAPMEISRKIRDLITPDMEQTPEGLAAKHKIESAAVQYEKDWTLDQLNHRRMNVDKKLSRHYERASMGQYADPVEADIGEAERGGAANIVYGEWGKANPGKNARLMKEQHGALWKMDDAINGQKGAINDLKAKQSDYKAEGGRMGQLRGGANISKTGVHGYLANVADAAFGGGGPMDRANAKVRKAFQKRPGMLNKAGRVAWAGAPVAHQLTPPPQMDDEQ